MTDPGLTSRQQQAQRIYNEKFFLLPATRLSPALLFAYRALIYVVGYGFIFFMAVSPRRLPADYTLTFLVALLMIFILTLMMRHKSAIAAVRRAGLWDEERTIVARTAQTFEGETLMFRDGHSRLSDAALALFLVVLGMATGGLVCFFATHFVEQILAVLCFGGFCGCAFWIMANSGRPNVRVDARGVFAFHRNLWPRLVGWSQIESAELHRWNHPYDGKDVHTVTLKDADGRTLLKLSNATFQDAPPGFEAHLVAEMKRRLMGADVDSRDSKEAAE